jgi:hypothetical protein
VTDDQQHSEEESCRIIPEEQLCEDGLSLGRMDQLDKLTAIAIIIILVVGAVIITNHAGDEQDPAKPGRAGARQAIIIISPEFDNKIKLTKTLLTTGNLVKARELIDGMIKDYPYDGRPHMLLGDLYIHDQQPVTAMLEYRKGIDLNPDFLDKKTTLFRGKQIKGVLKEARQLITAGLAKKPGDPKLKGQLHTLYYMLRRVAGSCG